MATYQSLGQANPAATTNTTLYTASAPAVGSTLVIVNQGSSDATVRVWKRPLGAAVAASQVIVYDLLLRAAGSNANAAYLTIGLSFQNSDVVTVWASTASVSFVLEGVESP